MPCQLKLEFFATHGKASHEVEQPRIPERTLHYLSKWPLLNVGIAHVRTLLDVIRSAFNKWLQTILNGCAIWCDQFVILHAIKAA